MSEFTNNLKRDDPVEEASTKKRGTIARAPWRKLRAVYVRFNGEPKERRVDVMDLRLVVDGVAEDVAPVTGDAPPLVRTASTGPTVADPASAIKAQRETIKKRMDSMTEEFKGLRLLDDRLSKALAALEGRP